MPEPSSGQKPDQSPNEKPAPGRQSMSARAKRAAIALLFSTILLIPRIRRLRRRTWAWTVIRIAVAAAGVAIIWHTARAVDVAWLIVGSLLVAAGIFVHARPETKSIDATARELDALIVLNGGAFFATGAVKPVPDTSIFVNPERLLVLNRARQQVAAIPVSKLRRLTSCQVAPGPERNGAAGAWDLEMTWGDGESCTARFRYDGFFAEHLARVAQQTIASVWQQGLPVLKS
jgi:hypothetical protein